MKHEGLVKAKQNKTNSNNNKNNKSYREREREREREGGRESGRERERKTNILGTQLFITIFIYISCVPFIYSCFTFYFIISSFLHFCLFNSILHSRSSIFNINYMEAWKKGVKNDAILEQHNNNINQQHHFHHHNHNNVKYENLARVRFQAK